MTSNYIDNVHVVMYIHTCNNCYYFSLCNKVKSLSLFLSLSVSLCLSLSFSLSLCLPLQRVCQDKIFPFIEIFAKGGGRSGTEPVRGYFLTFIIAVACIAIGK